MNGVIGECVCAWKALGGWRPLGAFVFLRASDWGFGGTEAYGEELTEMSCEKERRNRSLGRRGEGKRQGGRRALRWSGVVLGDGFSFLGAVCRKRMNKFCGTLEKC